jgi:hypothetical protein
MSRGPGRWQRAILERLQTREQFYLTEILPEHTTEVGSVLKVEMAMFIPPVQKHIGSQTSQ